MISTLLVSSGLLAADGVKQAFEEGQFSGNWRTIYMNTNNESGRQDWNALATGVKLKFETAPVNGFKLGIAEYLTLDLDSNWTVVEPVTNRGNRYEGAMFDLKNPNDKTVALLGEFYLNWSDEKHQLDLGRMKLKTPLMNAFDGRMIPNLFEGGWYKNKAIKGWNLQMGAITGIAVRGTSEFEDLDQAVGILSQGKAPDGSNSNYKGNLETDYVLVTNASYAGFKDTKLHFWNYYWDNVMNSTYLEATHKIKGEKISYSFGGQLINQRIVGDGGNVDQALSFVEDDFEANVFGLKMTVAGYGAQFTVAAVDISDDGRFTKPREWGKDPLYTFQRRELGDGYGDTSSWLVRLKYNFAKIGAKGLVIVADHAKHDRPQLIGAERFRFNKYAFPSFNQTNLNLIYRTEQIKGLKVELLYVHKTDDDDTGNAAFQQNKAQVDHLSFIANYQF